MIPFAQPPAQCVGLNLHCRSFCSELVYLQPCCVACCMLPHWLLRPSTVSAQSNDATYEATHVDPLSFISLPLSGDIMHDIVHPQQHVQYMLVQRKETLITDQLCLLGLQMTYSLPRCEQMQARLDACLADTAGCTMARLGWHIARAAFC